MSVSLDTVVYLVRACFDGKVRVKIGWANGPWPIVRMQSLQACSPVPLELVAAIPGGRVEEAALHQRFAASRVHHEWFVETPEILAAFQPNALEGRTPVDVLTALNAGRRYWERSVYRMEPK